MEENTNPAIVDAEMTLRKISGLIKINGRKILKNYPITSTQFIALQWITEEGDLTIGELSNKIGLAFSTTTDLVDRMEKNKLVKRVRDEADRRVVRVRVLEEGISIINEVIEKRQVYLGEVFETFSAEETSQLNKLLSDLHDQMRSVYEKSNGV